MCGRYVSPDQAAIERAWHIGRSTGNPFKQRYNVAPTTQIPILRSRPGPDAGFALAEARWGLIPPWWKEAKPPQSTFNARAEDAASKPMWRQAFRHSRCLVPAVGYYEWKSAESVDPATGEVRRTRQPYFIHPADGRLICFAGLLSAYRAADETVELSCAILTRAAAGASGEIHHRMPVVVPEPELERWVDSEVSNPEEVMHILEHARIDFQYYPVSTRLNTAKEDDEELVRPLQ